MENSPRNISGYFYSVRLTRPCLSVRWELEILYIALRSCQKNYVSVGHIILLLISKTVETYSDYWVH